MTTITESFNTADSPTLGPDLTWIEIQNQLGVASSTAVITSTNLGAIAVAQTSIGTADHYAKSVVDCDPGTVANGGYVGLILRNSGTSTDQACYKLFAAYDTGNFLIQKQWSESSTNAISSGGTLGVSETGTLKATAISTTLSIYWNDVLQVSATDTSFPTGNYTGLVGYLANGGTGSWDNFEAGSVDGPHSATETLWVVQSNQRW